MTDPRKITEDMIHIAIVELLQLKGHQRLLFFHPANGMPRDPRTGAKLKRMGVQPGVADFALTLPDGRSAFLEVKTPTGRVSMSQAGFRSKCYINGVPYAIVRSLSEAEDVLAAWGALNNRVRVA